MSRLPLELEDQVWRQIEQYEQETRMSYLTTAERTGHERGLEEGRAEGLLNGIAAILEVRFGQLGVDLMPEIQQLDDVSALERVLQAIKTLGSLDEIRAVYTERAE
jgi:hypothetical protein